ncbi:MAG: cytochrome c oxidase subunit II [Arthrospira sp. SH-MAG29]|nr:cytochrome c oxidase subunit II [Arthrospira sp. SH-MAG29]MBS0016575.1 cytochrome c oxidase subunit II [Arthrospira sp. SH-MAG29]
MAIELLQQGVFVNIPSSIWTLLVGIAITLISLWYGQNHDLLPVAASPEAAEVDQLFDLMITIAFGLVLLVEGALVVSLIRFRRRTGDNTDGPPIHGNIPLEIVWTAIPAVIVLGIGIYSFDIYNQMGGLDPMASGSHSMADHARMSGSAIAASLSDTDTEDLTPRGQQISLGIGASPEEMGTPADLTIDVNGLQYAWIFNYQNKGVISGELHVAVDQEVQLNISAQDVIHALWVPELRLKQDAIPGRTTELRFTPNRVGTYNVVCAELCGGYHGAMRTAMIVHTPEEFEAWVAENSFANNPDQQPTLATNPRDMSEGEFLAPFVPQMGIDQHQAIAKLPHHHHQVGL